LKDLAYKVRNPNLGLWLGHISYEWRYPIGRTVRTDKTALYKSE